MEGKLAFILGCGETGMFMPENVGAYVIGVNDAGKFEKSIDELVFINRARHFQEQSDKFETLSRLAVIRGTKVKRVVTLDTLKEEWAKHFMIDQIHTIVVTRWRKDVQLDKVYHTDNSPFTAMSYAVTLGFTDIVLWGVDFINHRYLKPETSSPSFNQFAWAAQKKLGTKIYKGDMRSNLNLPVWEQLK